jgi:hypothetical protein
MDWHTVKDTPTFRSLPSWQKSTGDACPHGLSIIVVNGTYVRNHFDSDFDQGGNGYAYTWIPKSQIWIADECPDVEWPFVAFHECTEVEHMKAGMSYNKAHAIAKRMEDLWRRLYSGVSV